MAALAQLVEHRFVVPTVVGSSPTGRPKITTPRASGVLLYFGRELWGENGGAGIQANVVRLVGEPRLGPLMSVAN